MQNSAVRHRGLPPITSSVGARLAYPAVPARSRSTVEHCSATSSTSQFLNYETCTVNVTSTGETGGDGATRTWLQRGTDSGTLTVGYVGSGMTVVHEPARWEMEPQPSRTACCSPPGSQTCLDLASLKSSPDILTELNNHGC